MCFFFGLLLLFSLLTHPDKTASCVFFKCVALHWFPLFLKLGDKLTAIVVESKVNHCSPVPYLDNHIRSAVFVYVLKHELDRRVACVSGDGFYLVNPGLCGVSSGQLNDDNLSVVVLGGKV